MSISKKASIPSWLEESPEPVSKKPTETKLQELPFQDLTWENFERLCLRLIKEEATIEHCQLYGERGDDQQGIDIYARLERKTDYIAFLLDW